MKKNEKLLQEAFFKKSYADKMKSKFGEYKPADKRQVGQPGFGAIMDAGLAVTDTKEAGKRLISSFGASIGVNSVRGKASRSIKSFPIIISENVEPETSVMIKRVMEEQYAEYVSLLISNQIVDISAFSTSEEEGNIAIQALDILAPEDQSDRLKRKMAMGKVEYEDLLGQSSAFNLIRNESKEYKTANPLFNSLLEDAFIVSSEDAEGLIEFMQVYSDEIAEMMLTEEVSLNEDNTVSLQNLLNNLKGSERKKDSYTDFSQFVDANFENDEAAQEIEDIDAAIAELDAEIISLTSGTISSDTLDTLEEREHILMTDISIARAAGRTRVVRSLTATLSAIRIRIRREKTILRNPGSTRMALSQANKEKSDLTARKKILQKEKEIGQIQKSGGFKTTDVFLDKKALRQTLNQSIAQILFDNDFLREKFEKSSLLLESNRIWGKEYIDYLTLRLGIPVPTKTRQKIISMYPLKKVIDPNSRTGLLTRRDIKRIESNKLTNKTLRQELLYAFSVSGKKILATTLLGTAIGAGTGYGVGTALAGTALAFGPLGLAIIGTAAVGTYVGGLMGNLLFGRKTKALQGWERVESLIEAMEEQQKEIRKLSIRKNIRDTIEDRELEKEIKALEPGQNQEDAVSLTSYELNSLISSYSEKIKKDFAKVQVNESEDLDDSFFGKFLTEETLELWTEGTKEYLTELYNSEENQQILQEAKISTTIPVQLVKQYEYDTEAKPTILVAPEFSTRSQYAYGEVEYDKRTLKDRRYNSPLLMTVKFKERFSDGTFSDNELVAVIGILGVITRVPSEEMEYILKSNAEGQTLEGIFSADKIDPKKLLSNLLGVEKIKKDVSNLPVSKDVWNNLQKISALALSNKMAGKRTDNIANAHIVFSQKEVDNIKADDSVDYLRNVKLVGNLMKRYSAFTVMIANDISERLFIYDDVQAVNWDVVPYSSFRNKDTGDQLDSMLSKMRRGM
jgi:hypothetical protein